MGQYPITTSCSLFLFPSSRTSFGLSPSSFPLGNEHLPLSVGDCIRKKPGATWAHPVPLRQWFWLSSPLASISVTWWQIGSRCWGKAAAYIVIISGEASCSEQWYLKWIWDKVTSDLGIFSHFLSVIKYGNTYTKKQCWWVIVDFLDAGDCGHWGLSQKLKSIFIAAIWMLGKKY